MTQDEIEQMARELYEQQDFPPSRAHTPWEHQLAPIKNVWRDLVQGNAGAAVD